MAVNISYSVKGDSVVTKPSLVENYKYRIVDGFELIESLNTENDHLVSVSFKEYYMKEIGTTQVVSGKVQHLGLNNLWTNMNTCSMVQQ